MIDLPADIEDRAAYPLVDIRDRWIFNKLQLAERLGHRCGPSGTPITVPGMYCIRPVMNCAGNGHGGVLQFLCEATSEPDDNDTIIGGITQPPFAPGYFWCEWFDGMQTWTDYVNDAPVEEAYETSRDPRDLFYRYRTSNYAMPTVPPLLQGLSINLTIEAIGGNIIEVSPRHMYEPFGPDKSFLRKFRSMPPWGVDSKSWWYWRTLEIE